MGRNRWTVSLTGFRKNIIMNKFVLVIFAFGFSQIDADGMMGMGTESTTNPTSTEANGYGEDNGYGSGSGYGDGYGSGYGDDGYGEEGYGTTEAPGHGDMKKSRKTRGAHGPKVQKYCFKPSDFTQSKCYYDNGYTGGYGSGSGYGSGYGSEDGYGSGYGDDGYGEEGYGSTETEGTTTSQ